MVAAGRPLAGPPVAADRVRRRRRRRCVRSASSEPSEAASLAARVVAGAGSGADGASGASSVPRAMRACTSRTTALSPRPCISACQRFADCSSVHSPTGPPLDFMGAVAAATGGRVALLVAPVSEHAIAEAGEVGLRFPRKTTFFVPKPRAGLVIRDFTTDAG